MKIKPTFSLIVMTAVLAAHLNGQDILAAARKGDLKAVQAFVGADPGQIGALTAGGSTPLIVAASNGYIPVVSFLLDRGADLQAANKQGRTALHYAVDGKHLAAAKFLIEKGADVNGRKEFPYTPLHIASGNGDEEMVDLLLSKGADVNILSGSGTPLHRAVFGGNANIIRRLLAAGADVQAENPSSGWTPLHVAAINGGVEAVEVLVEKGINLDAVDKRGMTALHYAAAVGSGEAEKVAVLLLKKGAAFNTTANDESTPLSAAVQKGKDDAVGLFLEKGADVGTKDKAAQRSLLHLAAIQGYGNIAGLLIKNGIDIHARDRFGKTALDYAEKHGNQKVAESISAAGGRSGDAEKNIGRSRYLRESLSEGEAYVWKLASFGWVVKTKNRLFVFNNEEHNKKPDEPLLANGFISASELADQNILAVYPAYHGEAYAKEFIHAIEDSLKKITYIHYRDDKLQGNRNTVSLGGVGDVIIQETAIAYAEEHEEGGMGWLNYRIETDGLSFYYSGFLRSPLEMNKKNLEHMARERGTCDAAFLLLSAGEGVSGQIDQVISILKPKVIFLHMALSTPSDGMIETLRKKYPDVKFASAREAGERFHFKDKRLL